MAANSIDLPMIGARELRLIVAAGRWAECE